MTGMSKSPADELEPVDAREVVRAADVLRELWLGYIERRDEIYWEGRSYRVGDRRDPDLESAEWQDDVERWDDVQEESDAGSSANLSAGKTERVEDLGWRDKLDGGVGSYQVGDGGDPDFESGGWQDDIERWGDVREEINEESSANLSAEETERAEGLQSWRLVVCVFLPFAFGYYLSYLFRTINTLISGPLSREFHLDAANLGLLTSVYLLFFGGVQIPIGILLDRFGPRRVQGVLLIVAAAGAALFGASGGFVTLLIARAMIGIGVAAALMAGLKAIVMWFPRERIALVNGYMVMMGSLGALSATAPAEWLLRYAGWRGLFELLAVATLATAVLIVVAVPEKARAVVVAGTAPVTLRTIYSDRRFWRIAPLSSVCIGSAWALQGLWAGPWLSDVEGLDRESLIRELFMMGLGLCVGAVFLGTLATRLRQRGIGADKLFAIVAALFMGAEIVLISRLPVPSLLPWFVVSLVGAATVLSYAMITEYFPIELAARANGSLNLLHFAWGFAAQFGIGLILQQWPAEGGHYPAIAYQTAFGVNAGLQVVALGWFVAPWIWSQIGRVKTVVGRDANARELVATVFVIQRAPAVGSDSSVMRSRQRY
jgi:MFS family permease